MRVAERSTALVAWSRQPTKSSIRGPSANLRGREGLARARAKRLKMYLYLFARTTQPDSRVVVDANVERADRARRSWHGGAEMIIKPSTCRHVHEQFHRRAGMRPVKAVAPRNMYLATHTN